MSLFRTCTLSALLAAFAAAAGAVEAPETLPAVTVFSPRVANQTPTGTFVMPVSALRFEPRVELQGRNLVEGQADVTVRGGIFENTGFRVGAVSVLDPQTGHYFAELPIAPQMLGAPEVRVGSDLALGQTNATAGAVAYTWRQVAGQGALQLGAGPHALWRADLYQGASAGGSGGGPVFGIDVAVAHSESDGPLAYSDHRFDRLNARFQVRGANWQTDWFAGYQAKFFGWPNLYTPFNSNETENLQTVLLMVDHRVQLSGDGYVTAGAYYRRNKDDYAFNRFAPVGPVHPFQHTTWQRGAAVEGRTVASAAALFYRAELLSDHLQSTSLTAGRYRSRTLSKLTLVPETSWAGAEGTRYTARLGGTYDDSDREPDRFSPVIALSRATPGTSVRRVYASYAQTSQVPTYTALNSSAASGLFRGNPNLGRQVSRTLEVGATAVFQGWTIDAALFGRRDLGLVDWTFRQGVTARTANALDVDTTGVEVVARRSGRRVDLVLGYTGLAKDPDYRGAAVDASFYALNYAKHRLTAAATVRLTREIEVRVDNEARLQADNPLRTQGGNDTLATTVGLGYRPRWVRGLELTLQVDNLWNSRFQVIPAVPPTPRTWSVGASYVW